MQLFLSLFNHSSTLHHFLHHHLAAHAAHHLYTFMHTPHVHLDQPFAFVQIFCFMDFIHLPHHFLHMVMHFRLRRIYSPDWRTIHRFMLGSNCSDQFQGLLLPKIRYSAVRSLVRCLLLKLSRY